MTEIILTTIVLICSRSKTPVKLRIICIVLFFLIILLIWFDTGTSLGVLLMSMLFAGGVLIIFIILSSFNPNEKSTKIKIRARRLIIIWFLSLHISNIFSPRIQLSLELKGMYQSHFSIGILMALIIFYFYVMNKIIKKEENSMRA